jgi:hypothetical protein
MSLVENWIRDLNYIDSAKRDKKFTRIRSIDFVKGLAICLIVLGHTGEIWVSQEWLWAHAMLFPILDVFGPSLFIFLSALSVVFSCKKKECVISERVIKQGIYTRTIVIVLLGLVFNIITSPASKEYPFPSNLFAWNILMFIGFSQIFCYYAIKLSKELRIVLGILIVFFADPIREYMFLNKDTNPIIFVIHYILISPAPHNPVFPYVALALFSTIYGEYIFEAMIFETPDSYMDTFKTFIKHGIIYTIAGVLFGLELITATGLPASDYIFVEYIPIMQQAPPWAIHIEGLPRFIIRGTGSNILYVLGMALLIIGISFYFIDYKHLRNPFQNSLIDMWVFYGQVSLSIFFIHYIGAFFFYRALNVVFFFPIIIPWIGFLGILMYLWNKEADGKGSFEWLIANMGGGKKKKKKKNTPII